MNESAEITTNDAKAKQVISALTKKDYTVHYAATKAEAKDLSLGLIPSGATVGLGGSVTARELGLLESLRNNGHEVFDHWEQGLSEEEILSVRYKQTVADYFLTSANAITLAGEIVNLDGLGNRVAASIFGPKNVIMIVGINKVTRDLSEALERSQRVAGVKNAQRLNYSTPCVTTGECIDCASPGRICNISVILHKRPMWGKLPGREYHVILVGEEIGF
ncbi:MAG: lactate utilization protein [Thermincola sp.]|jgi:L-lactate utilization protein LutB|nr:lactate utilization protein [Thermincola sp.]MDT3703798.1 lactate utilization protein [Thermincola sp.]